MAKRQEVPIQELDLWGIPPVQKSIVADIDMHNRPTSSISWTSPLDFDFTLGADEYMLFNESYLYLKIKPTFSKANNVGFVDGDYKTFVPANYFLHSIIDKISLTIGSSTQTIEDQKYAYKAYLEALLGYSEAARESHLSSSLWIDDEATRASKLFDLTTHEPKTFELKGKLHSDFTHQNRAIIGGCHIRLQVTLNKKPTFFMKFPTGGTVEFLLLDAIFCARRMKVAPNVLSAHHKALSHATAKYPISRTKVLMQTITTGSQYVCMDKAISGKTPRRIFFALTSTKSLGGSNSSIPFKFEPFDLAYIVCYNDGDMIPRNGYNMDYKAGLFVDAYTGLIQALNQNGTDSYANIDTLDFAINKCIYGFNLCPDLSNGSATGLMGHFPNLGESNIRFDLRFQEPTAQSLTAVIFTEYDTVMEINSDRQLINPSLL